METLANLEAFIRSAEAGSFSEAARRLSLTPAAVSRNVAMLERNLGVRLFHRSTRRLTLTEAGDSLRLSIADKLEGIQAAIAAAATSDGEPSGTLKVSLPPTLGIMHILPLLPGFRERYPRVQPEWHFENRPVDLIAEGYDVAIGGGFDLTPGLVARTLAPAHIVAVASPGFMKGLVPPADPAGLQAFDGIVMRSLRSSRIRHWTLRNASGQEMAEAVMETIVVNDPAAMREAAVLGMGVAMLAVPDVLPDLQCGRLVRLCPHWYADAGAISLYFASRLHLPAKTRVFIDWISAAFAERQLAAQLAGSLA